MAASGTLSLTAEVVRGFSDSGAMANTLFTTKKANIVLGELRKGLSITSAMAAIGIERTHYYRWRDQHPEFATAADAAIEAGTDRLEDIAVKRAEDQSDTLLIFLLKARRREKFGDRQQLEHRGVDGGPLILVHRVTDD